MSSATGSKRSEQKLNRTTRFHRYRFLVLALILLAACDSRPRGLDLVEAFPGAIAGPVIGPTEPLWEFTSHPFIGAGFRLPRRDRPRTLIAERGALRFYLLHQVPVTLHFKGRPGRTGSRHVRVSVNGHELGSMKVTRTENSFNFKVDASLLKVGKNLVTLEDGAGTRWDEFRVLSGPEQVPSVSEGQLQLPFGSSLDFALELDRGARLTLTQPDLWYEPGAPLESKPWRLRVRLRGQTVDRNWTLEKASSIDLGVSEPGRYLVTLQPTAEAPLPGQLGLKLKAHLETAVIPGQTPSPPPPGRSVEPSEPQPHNVILYLVDTLRTDYLGCYGQTQPLTPHLDRFAQEAVLFEQALAQSPWTQPSVASIFTSLDPRAHRVEDFGDVLGDDFLTLAEVLSSKGYQTHGWVTNPLVRNSHGYDQGFQSYRLLFKQNSLQVTGIVRDWLDRRDQQRPFFLYIHTLDPHETYDPPQPFKERFAAGYQPTAHMELARLCRTTEGRRQRLKEPHLAPETRSRLTALYAAEVAANDQAFGDLLEALKARKLYENTLIVFVSDHGEEFGEHGYLGHMNSLHRELVEVPLLIKFPGVSGGQRVTEPIEHLDLAPTILRALGIEPPQTFQGIPWQDNPDPERPISINLNLGRRAWQDKYPMPRLALSRRRGNRLVIRSHSTRTNRTEPLQYYDLESDPEERQNLFFSRHLEAMFLLSELQRADHPYENAPEVEKSDSDSVEEMLRSLNYL